MMTITLKINGMHCTSCAFNIDGELEDMDGVKEASTNYAKQVTRVTFDEQKVSPDKFQMIISGLGYSASVEN
ncbi:MAG: heavy-metal-associated domain-containing protein [Patescibacteria group bacterium]